MLGNQVYKSYNQTKKKYLNIQSSFLSFAIGEASHGTSNQKALTIRPFYLQPSKKHKSIIYKRLTNKPHFKLFKNAAHTCADRRVRRFAWYAMQHSIVVISSHDIRQHLISIYVKSLKHTAFIIRRNIITHLRHSRYDAQLRIYVIIIEYEIFRDIYSLSSVTILIQFSI